MKGCWDPEFKPSAWTIDEIWRFCQFTFFGKLEHWGDFPIQYSLFEAQ